jgi:hypothetical protein
MYVPVVDKEQRPLMPTTSSRAATWIKSGKATPFWKKGVFCVRLNVEPSDRKMQDIAVGVDPGSKKEGFTIKSEAHTYLNIQTDAVTWVKDAVEVRRNMRRARRFRKTPCRQPRANRLCHSERLPPSTKARWQWKLRIINWLRKMYPMACVVVEDIKAATRQGKRRWNVSFSPLEAGKEWFYSQVRNLVHLETRQGFETKELRDSLGLKKSNQKMSDKFEAHCVDSWVLANWYTGGHTQPDNTGMLLVSPLRFHRRQLHRLQAEEGGIRKPYGGTRSLGYKRGSLVKHLKYGLVYIGGNLRSRLSLHSLADGKRLTQNAQPQDCRFLTFNSWRCASSSPCLKAGVSLALR